MPVRVTGPDGNNYDFPDGTTKESAISYFKSKGIGGIASTPLASAAPAQPGVGARFSESTGIPTSRQGFREAGQGLKAGVQSPIGIGGEMIKNYGQNIVSEGRRAFSELNQPGGGVEAPGVGLPPAIAKFLLRGPLGPVGGTGVGNFIEDVPGGNVRGAIGDVLGSFLNAFLLRKGMAPSAEKSANKLAFAAGPDTHAPIAATLPDLKAVADKPRSLDDFVSVVRSAKGNLHRDVGNAIGPIANRQANPFPIVQRLNDLITPNMRLTADGQADIAKIRSAMTEFSQPWTIGELDAERGTINQRMDAFYRKKDVSQYAALANRSTAIDKAIADTIRDTIYPQVDSFNGFKPGTFRNLRDRQGNLMNLESDLKAETARQKDVTARIQGAPRFSHENVSLYGHPTSGRMGTALHGIQRVLKKPNPLAVANTRVAQGFSRGNPIARGATATLPFRQTLFPQEQQQ